MTSEKNSNTFSKEAALDALLERNDRDFVAFRSMLPTDQARYQAARRIQYARDPWLFLSECVFTLDPVNQDHPVKPFPSYLEYLEFLTRLWLRERQIAIPKSRRMVCSWNFISLYTWDTIFNAGRHNAFVSKKEDDAGDLVSRAEFIFRNIPDWRIPAELLPKLKNGKMSKQPPVMEFEEIQSKLQGFPQGADQMRQFTLSGILGDECAFWEHAQAFYSASKPTLDGGGRMTLISSRSPGFFKKIVFDQLDSDELTFREQPAGPVQRPIEGVEVWKNPKNRFCVVDLHYTADPAKRGHAWREAVRTSMPARDFAMEYEKSWQTFEGRAVYTDFNQSLHVSRVPVRPEPGVPLLLGWDFGLTPACILAQLVGRQLKILHEFVESNGSITKLAPVVLNHLRTNYLPWLHGDNKLIFYVDPAGFQRAQTDEKTCVDVLREVFGPGVSLQPGPVAWEARRKSVEEYLIRTYGEGPGLVISETAPILIEGFNGGYQYPEKALEVEPAKLRPVKNKFSHPHDALQYVCAGSISLRKAYRINLPTPSYGFAAG